MSRNDRPPWPGHTWLGLAILAGGQVSLALGWDLTATWFTPIEWTGYILLADGLVCRLSGSSWLQSQRREFPFLVLASIAVWLVFEGYNLRLRNWIYLGLPENPWLRDLGYFWSFATIMPAVFETADLGAAIRWRHRAVTFHEPAAALATVSMRLWGGVGALLVLVPLLLPSEVAAHLFAFVWVGYVPLLEAVNARLGAASILRAGQRAAWAPLLGAGLFCGLLWEGWNFQAYLAGGAHWVYTLPEALRPFGLHFGRMPVLGLLGFPPFALELYAFYALLRRGVVSHRLPEADGRG
jgi:hypothetical protein